MTDVRDPQVDAELVHWRSAALAMADLETVAAPAAWCLLEDYLRVQVRHHLLAAVQSLVDEGARAAAAADAGEHPDLVRRRVLALRRRYVQVESVVEFYGDAVNTRTNPTLGAILGGLDTIAVDSMEVLLRPLGIDPPPALVWLDRGTGAAILKAGLSLWGGGGLTPVAAIKLTRHNLGHPTALLHETGHQVCQLTGWTDELAGAIDEAVTPYSAELAALWRGWAGEIGADVHAFVLAGWAPVPALANVVDGPTTAVHRIRPRDVHPPALLRVLLNVELCRRWFGSAGTGAWDRLGAAWLLRHDPRGRGTDDAQVAAASLALLPTLAAVCTEHPYAAFGRRAISELADPRRVSPEALDTLARRAGPSLLTSRYLARTESLRILAHLGVRPPTDPVAAASSRNRLLIWLAGLAGVPLPSSAIRAA